MKHGGSLRVDRSLRTIFPRIPDEIGFFKGAHVQIYIVCP